MFKSIFVVLAIIAAVSAAPGLLLQSSPLLARLAHAPEAPASTAHASHVAALSPIAYAAAPLAYAHSGPLAYAAPAGTYTYAAPYTYDSGFAYAYAPSPFQAHAI